MESSVPLAQAKDRDLAPTGRLAKRLDPPSAEDLLAEKLLAAAERWHAIQRGGAATEHQPTADPRPEAALRRARGERGPLDALLGPRPNPAALSVLDRLGDPERLVVSLVREIGPERALAILPPVLARAVRGLRDVARLLAGPSLDR